MSNSYDKYKLIEKKSYKLVTYLNSIQLLIAIILLFFVVCKHKSRQLFALAILILIIIQSALSALFACIEAKDHQWIFLSDGLYRGSLNLALAYHWIFAIQYL